MARALINVPAKAKPGEIIEIKVLTQHPMETGFRPDHEGKLIPRDIVNSFACVYDGAEIFRADLFPAVAANPYLAFTTTATRSGVITFAWTDDQGRTQTESRSIVVE